MKHITEELDTLRDQLDENYSLSLKEITPLIDRVALRYPELSKYEITMIVRTFFETIRLILLSGGTISLNGFLPNMHIISYSRILKNKFNRVMKVKLSTPKELK